MAGEHKHGVALWVQGSAAVAHRILGVGVGGGFDIVIEYFLCFELGTGGRAGVE